VKVFGIDCVTMDIEELDSGITFDHASWPGVGKEDDERSRS
jgi:hypothetical protein